MEFDLTQYDKNRKSCSHDDILLTTPFQNQNHVNFNLISFQSVYLHVVDLSKPVDVFNFAKKFNEEQEKVDVLVSIT